MAGINLPGEVWEWNCGIGVESTYGTGVAPTQWFRVKRFGLTVLDEVQAHQAMPGVPTELEYDGTRPRARLGMPDVSGAIEFESEGDDIGFLLEQMLGTGVFSAGGAVNEIHTFSAPTAPAAMPASLTIVGDNGVGDLRYNGCVMRSMEFTGTGDELVGLTCDFVGQSADTVAVSPGSLSTAPFFEFWNSAVRRDAVGSAITSADDLEGGEAVLGYSLRIERALRVVQASGDGVRGTREPIMIKPGYTITLTADKDWFSTTFQSIMFNSTLISRFSNLQLFLDGGEAVVGGDANYSLELNMPAAILQGDRPTMDNADVVPERLRFKAAYDGTNIFQAVLSNGTLTGVYSA